MTGEPRESHLATGAEQTALLNQAAEVFGVPPDELQGWGINRLRPDGIIDADVPRDSLINIEGVSIDPDNVEHLVGLFDEFAAEVGGGTGQRDAVAVCHVPGEGFYLVDGFHRHEVQGIRGVDQLNATVEPNMTYEQVVKRMLEYARAHPEIEFARQVEWIQTSWERTPWAADMPNVLTAFRAIKEDYAYDETDDIDQIDRLSDRDHAEICAWVKNMSAELKLTPKEIREKLAKVESLDPELMKLVYQRKGSVPEGRIGLGHVEVITEVYPGEFDFQAEVVRLITEEQLTVPQTKALLEQIEQYNPSSLKSFQKAVQRIDMTDVRAASYSQNGSRSSRGSRASSNDRSNGSHPQDLLSALRARINQPGDSEAWTDEEAEAAIELAHCLSEVVVDFVETQGETTPDLLKLQTNLGALSILFAELVSRVEEVADEETEAARNIREAFTEFLHHGGDRMPRVKTKLDIEKARQALDTANGRWSPKRKEQLEAAADEAEEYLAERRERIYG